MVGSLVRSSVNFRLLVLPAAAALLVVGVLQLREAPVDVLPEFSPPYVEVQTEALGLSAAEVEELITVPLERDLLNGVAGIDVIRSQSVLGLSSVTLVFEPGTDLMSARQLVQERLIQSHILPNVSKPPTMLQPLSSRSRVLMIGLSSREHSLIDLGVLARWTIRPRLLGVPGVANVVIWGQREHQLQVQVDPRRLRKNGVTLQQVVSTAGNAQLVSPLSFLEASTPGTGGFIDTPNQRLQVRHILPIARPEGLAQVPVDGTRMRLGEVTDVVVDHQPLIGDAVVGGRPGLLLVVEKFPGANTLEVTRDVESALAAMRPGLAGVEIDPAVFRPANFLENVLDNLALAAVIGFALLALAVAAAFLDWRAAVVVLVTIPLALVAATLVLVPLGQTLNALVLAGLVAAVGIVVDDAVVGVHCARRRGTAPLTEAWLAARGSLGFATAIVLVAVLPVLGLQGRVGDFFEPFGLAYAAAVLASFLVALTVGPALAYVLVRGDASAREPLRRRYDALLARALGRGRAVLVAACALGVLALATLTFFDRAVVPSFDERELLVQLEAAPGTSRGEMVRIASRLERDLRAQPGVRNVGGHVGRAVMGDRVVGASSGELWLTIDTDADYDEAVRGVRGTLDGYPGLERELVTYSAQRIDAVGAVERGGLGGEGDLAALTGRRDDLVVRVYGKELGVLRQKASEVRGVLASVDGVADARVAPRTTEPTLEVAPKLAAARRHGVKPGDVRRAAATLVQGIEVGSLFEAQKVFEVIVVGVPDTRHSVEAIRNLPIDTPRGGQVPLHELADLRVTAVPSMIEREATSRYADVVADVNGRDLGAVVEDVEAQLGELRFPLEYHAEVLRDSLELEAADRRLLVFALAAFVAVVLLLQAAFASWTLALVFAATLPFALLGGVVAAGGTLSLGALAGLLAVFGLAVRNGLLLVRRCQELERAGRGLRVDHVLRAAGERLAPFATTAAATALALVPLALLADVPGATLSLVVLGGLVTAALHTLLVVPAAYLLFGSSAEDAVAEELLAVRA